jgi:hypothetical protein
LILIRIKKNRYLCFWGRNINSAYLKLGELVLLYSTYQLGGGLVILLLFPHIVDELESFWYDGTWTVMIVWTTKWCLSILEGGQPNIILNQIKTAVRQLFRNFNFSKPKKKWIPWSRRIILERISPVDDEGVSFEFCFA